MNRNAKLFPSFLALSWDVMFVWGISTLFFSGVKGLSYSQIVLLDSFLMLAGAIAGLLVPKVFGKMNGISATRIAMLGYAGYLLLCIFGNQYWHFILAQFLLGSGYSIAGIKSNTVLVDSLSAVKRNGEYQKIYGKGLSMFYFLDAIGIMCISYVYDWNPIACYVISLCFVGLMIGVSFFMKNPSKFMERNFELAEDKPEIKDKNKPDSYIKILASSFFVFLLVYSALFRGMLFIAGNNFKIFMNQLIDAGTMPVWLFGVLYACTRLSSALMSKLQFKFDLKFGVRTLIIFSTYAILSFVVEGALYLTLGTSIVTIVLITLISFIQCSLRNPNTIFINNYLQVCTPKKNAERAFAMRTTLEYIVCAGTSALYSMFLSMFNDNYGLTCLVYVSVFAIPLVVSLTLFIRALCKKHAQKYTIIIKEYTED